MMPKKATTSAAATDMGIQTRSRSVQDTVGEVPLTAEQEERNIQVALAQTAKDAAARKVARATLKRRARLHNLKIKETGGDRHCLQYSVQDHLPPKWSIPKKMMAPRALVEGNPRSGAKLLNV